MAACAAYTVGRGCIQARAGVAYRVGLWVAVLQALAAAFGAIVSHVQLVFAGVGHRRPSQLVAC